MNYLDEFSGYGGFHLGLEQAGFKFDNVFFSEIDKHAIANYKYNFPNAKHVGSITNVSRASIGCDIDVISFGWPCQDNSIAGKRKGQTSGTRSGLLYEAVRTIDEFKPRVFFAENVEGLRSVNKGIDIVESLRVLSVFNESLPQYDIEMQLLNTRWFLPQNRERLIFIGHLREAGTRKVFPIGEDDPLLNESTGSGKGRTQAKYYSTTVRDGIGSKADGTFIRVENIKIIGNTHPSGRGMNVPVHSSSGIAPNLTTNKGEGIKISSARIAGWHENDNVVAAHGHDERRSTISEHVYHKPTGTMSALTVAHVPKLLTDNNIRRLTPIECERLQGLPDNHTKYGKFDGVVKEISDTQRYRLCSNGVSIPVVRTIGTKYLELNPL